MQSTMQIKDSLRVGFLHLPSHIFSFTLIRCSESVVASNVRGQFGLHQSPIQEQIVIESVYRIEVVQESAACLVGFTRYIIGAGWMVLGDCCGEDFSEPVGIAQ